ncbi:MAG: EamA family transporter [Nevskiaceae bacterium]|nr:MAG: EamA family transporter [Nevskiaceae bacterium]
MSAAPDAALRTRVLLAFVIVYLVWGSTYLGIRVAVEAIPPALCAGLRFDVAGTLILLYALAQGHRLPQTRRDWFAIVFSGAMMLIGGNGLVTYSEQWVPSNQAALIVATGALWIAWFGTFGSRGETLRPLAIVGLLLGFAGVAVLVGGGLSARAAPPLAYAALLLAPVTWAIGSVYSRRHPVSNAPLISAAVQMLAAGLVMTALGLATGEHERLHWAPRAFFALGYLIVFGSCVAYAAYVWLVHQVTPAVLGTYAYVNPAVAVLLGWLLLGETLTPAQVVGTLIILAGVVTVTLASARRAPPVVAKSA